MKEKIKKRKNHQLIDDIKTCFISFIILVIFVLLYILLEPLLGEGLSKLIFGFSGAIFGAGAFYYFTTRLIRIIGRLFKKRKWTNFGES